MNDEKAKPSKSSQYPLALTGCSIVSFLITLILGIVLAILGSILPLLYVTLYVGFDSKNIVFYVIGILLLMLISIVGVTYSLGKKIEYWTHLIVRYRGMQHEQKRIDRLMTQAKMETATETDNMDYLAEADTMNKENYS